MSLVIAVKIFFRKQKCLTVEIYKKLVLEEENSKLQKSTGETVKLKNQKDNFSETPERKELTIF